MLVRKLIYGESLPKEDECYSKISEMIRTIKDKLKFFLQLNEPFWTETIHYALIVSKNQSTSQAWHIDFGTGTID